MPPEVPTNLALNVTPDNTDKVTAWFLDAYASSAFNTCPHQPLPLMSGLSPLRIIIKEGSEPVAIHQPATVPAHRLEQVRLELEQDIALGVIERFPYNTPTTWCSRMHVTTDAWYGYHSVPLDHRDRHVTTFLTPWGRMRYIVAPQGSISSGDGFTYFYDMIIRHMPRKKKCVDDVAGWANTLVHLFQDTAEFLTHTSKHGIVQNPKKFIWGKKDIEYLGFWITADGVQPSNETLESIRDFPRPSDITGIRSWFGLVEQVAYAFSKSSLMEPFCPLLKSKAEYVWTPQLQHAFQTAKEEIVKIASKGVKSFTIGAHTCLITDWSRTGIGFVLWQKRCTCAKIHPSCFKNGWQIITCGSRFFTAAEERYHPIEGELLTVAWALQKTSYFILGCQKLLILVDHKPLIGLLTTRELGSIENPRL